MLEAFRAGLSSSALKVIDLSQVLSMRSPAFSASETMTYDKRTTLANDGYQSAVVSLPEHFGTHIDAPLHFCEGDSIDRLSISKLIVPAVVLDVRDKCRSNHDYQLTLEDVIAAEKIEEITHGAAILLLTGWGRRFANNVEYRNEAGNGVLHFPGFGLSAARYLIEEKGCCALGIDTLSIDNGASVDFAVHKFALKENIYLIENLANLDQLPARGSLLFCGPLKIEGGTGSPARILAVAYAE